jgi:hypothetical protein
VQNIEFKFIVLLKCKFKASDEEIVRQSITFRYNSVKSKVQLMEARLKDVNNLVKVKSPSLLLQLSKQQPNSYHNHMMASTSGQPRKSKMSQGSMSSYH